MYGWMDFVGSTSADERCLTCREIILKVYFPLETAPARGMLLQEVKNRDRRCCYFLVAI
jgi:hypothetical protein